MERPAVLAEGLHHVALGARDVERLAAFYRDVLGLTELMRHRHADGSLRSVWLGLGAAAVLMVEACAADPSAPEDRAEAKDHPEPGWFLLAFRIDEPQRAAWETRLADAGAAVESRSAATSYARDPEGNRFAVSFYPLPTPTGR